MKNAKMRHSEGTMAMIKEQNTELHKKSLNDVKAFVWELRGSNPRPSACKADALNQLS
jgi:hypothetical protein